MTPYFGSANEHQLIQDKNVPVKNKSWNHPWNTVYFTGDKPHL